MLFNNEWELIYAFCQFTLCYILKMRERKKMKRTKNSPNYTSISGFLIFCQITQNWIREKFLKVSFRILWKFHQSQLQLKSFSTLNHWSCRIVMWCVRSLLLKHNLTRTQRGLIGATEKGCYLISLIWNFEF